MRIAIITLPLRVNYGGNLQAFALQTVLKRMGHQVETLQVEQKRQLSYKRMPRVYLKRLIKKYIFKKPNTYVFEEQWWNNKAFPCMSFYSKQFLKKYVSIRYLNSINDIKESDYDCFIVGSDQVWRPCYFNFPIQVAFLDFTSGWKVKRMAYAPSFGTDIWEYSYEQTKECSELIKQFDFVSVRESSALNICKSKFNIEAKHVLDPTMLLKEDDYKYLFEAAQTPKSRGNLHYYILDTNKEIEELIKKISKDRELKPFSVFVPITGPCKDETSLTQPPVEEWLRAFYDSDFIITDSFHACVFSILFKKQFVVYGNETRGMARYYSLLSLFGLENRLISTYESYSKLKPIDYVTVHEKLNKLRKDSMEFLNLIS